MVVATTQQQEKVANFAIKISEVVETRITVGFPSEVHITIETPSIRVARGVEVLISKIDGVSATKLIGYSQVKKKEK